MRISAGLLMYRTRANKVEFLLVHPGGPFWKNKDAGAWTIPKGEIEESEETLATAMREFEEELGIKPSGPFIALAPIQQKGGKIIHAWAFEGEVDPDQISSNVFSREWPPRSGRLQEFPEVDRAAWFDLETAKSKINPAQISLLEEAQQKAERKQ
jgi:predicted NUDIX family NTP pyrophosphohydrolase